MGTNPTNKNKLPDDPSTGETLVRAGKLIRKIRDSVGLTQDRFSDSLHLSRSVIANAETGRDISRTLVGRLENIYPSSEEQTKEIRKLLLSKNLLSKTVSTADEADQEGDMFGRRASSSKNLEGIWYALWESTADHQEVVNSEEVSILTTLRGVVVLQNKSISPENPEGGYLWRAEGRLYDNQHYLGTYLPKAPEVRSKGCLYLVLHPSGKYLNGQWIGCNYDGEWARGLVVFSRDRNRLPDLLQRHRQQLPPLPYINL